ncbi:MAG: hypothetical protein ACFBSE_06950 [Prochloraceae cyanobacterium]
MTQLKNFLGFKFWWPLPLLSLLFWFGGKTLTIYNLECSRQIDFKLQIDAEIDRKITVTNSRIVKKNRFLN